MFNLKSIVSLPNTTPPEGSSLGALKIPASDFPKGFAGFKIDPAALAEALEIIKGIDPKACPLDYNFVKKGSPSLRKNAYFYLWLAAKHMEKQLGQKRDFDCESFANQMKAKAEAANDVAQLESDIRTMVLKNSNPKNGLDNSKHNTLYKNIDVSKTLELIYNLDFNDSDKVVVLMALHSILCSPSPSYGKLFVAFDTNEVAVKTLSKFLTHPHIKVSGIDILMGNDLTDPSTTIQAIKEKVFKANQNSQIKDIFTIYNNSKLNDFRIANALRHRRQYPAAETLYTQQFEKYMNEAQKNMSESEKQEFVSETQQILNKVDEALSKETNPNKMAMLQQKGWTAIYQLNKRKTLEALDRYFQNNKASKANDIKFQKAYQAFEAYKDMVDPMDEYFNLADATQDTIKDYTKEVATIVVIGAISQATAHTGSSFVYGVLARKSPEALARVVAMTVGFALNSGTFATLENVLSSNPQWNKEHYLHIAATFAVLGGAGQIGKALEEGLAKKLTEIFEAQLEKEYSTKFLNASLNGIVKGVPKTASAAESAISLSLYQIASSADLSKQILDAANNQNSHGQLKDLFGQILANNLVLVAGLKAANKILTLSPNKVKLAPDANEKLSKLAEQLNNPLLTPQQKTAATYELIRLCYTATNLKWPDIPKNLTPNGLSEWHQARLKEIDYKFDLQLFGKNAANSLVAPKLKISAEVMSAAQKLEIDLENLTTPKKLNSAFYKAAWKGSFALVKYFIEECGVDPNVKNSKGNPALPMVAGYGYENIVTYLLERGADIDITNGEGKTALDLARKYGQTKIINILTEFKNNPKVPPAAKPSPETTAKQTESPVIELKQINKEIDKIMGSKSVELESLHFYMIRLTPEQWNEFCNEYKLSQVARESLKLHMEFWEGTMADDAMSIEHTHFLKNTDKLKDIRLKLTEYYNEISFDFISNEFQNSSDIEALAKDIQIKFPEIKLDTSKQPVNQIQEILETPHFYDMWVIKNKAPLDTRSNIEIERLIIETAGYRNKLFSKLKPHEAQKIIKLNRLLLELTFHEKCPKKIPDIEETENEKKILPKIDKNKVLDTKSVTNIPLRPNGTVDISKLENNVVYQVAKNKKLNGVSTAVKVVFSADVLSEFSKGDRRQLVKQINSLARNGYEGIHSENKNGLVKIKIDTDKAANNDKWTLKVRITSGKRLLGWFLNENAQREKWIAYIDAFEVHTK